MGCGGLGLAAALGAGRVVRLGPGSVGDAAGPGPTCDGSEAAVGPEGGVGAAGGGPRQRGVVEGSVSGRSVVLAQGLSQPALRKGPSEHGSGAGGAGLSERESGQGAVDGLWGAHSAPPPAQHHNDPPHPPTACSGSTND